MTCMACVAHFLFIYLFIFIFIFIDHLFFIYLFICLFIILLFTHLFIIIILSFSKIFIHLSDLIIWCYDRKIYQRMRKSFEICKTLRRKETLLGIIEDHLWRVEDGWRSWKRWDSLVIWTDCSFWNLKKKSDGGNREFGERRTTSKWTAANCHKNHGLVVSKGEKEIFFKERRKKRSGRKEEFFIAFVRRKITRVHQSFKGFEDNLKLSNWSADC